jgi:hypothetical protein
MNVVWFTSKTDKGAATKLGGQEVNLSSISSEGGGEFMVIELGINVSVYLNHLLIP